MLKKMGCAMAKRILARNENGQEDAASNQSGAGQTNPNQKQPTINMDEVSDFTKIQDDPRMPLKVRQIFKITKSWKAIARTMSRTGTIMFVSLFEQNEDLLNLFTRFQHLKGQKKLQESMELQEHAATVMATLDQSINSLNNYDNFVAYLHSIGKLHRKVPGFKKSYFWEIEQPFLKAVKQTLDERCNETIEQIYKLAIKFIIETIMQGFGDDDVPPALRPANTSGSGGPDGGDTTNETNQSSGAGAGGGQSGSNGGGGGSSSMIPGPNRNNGNGATGNNQDHTLKLVKVVVDEFTSNPNDDLHRFQQQDDEIKHLFSLLEKLKKQQKKQKDNEDDMSNGANLIKFSSKNTNNNTSTTTTNIINERETENNANDDKDNDAADKRRTTANLINYLLANDNHANLLASSLAKVAKQQLENASSAPSKLNLNGDKQQWTACGDTSLPLSPSSKLNNKHNAPNHHYHHNPRQQQSHHQQEYHLNIKFKKLEQNHQANNYDAIKTLPVPARVCSPPLQTPSTVANSKCPHLNKNFSHLIDLNNQRQQQQRYFNNSFIDGHDEPIQINDQITVNSSPSRSASASSSSSEAPSSPSSSTISLLSLNKFYQNEGTNKFVCPFMIPNKPTSQTTGNKTRLC